MRVSGSAELLTLKLDHRRTDAPSSNAFFRIEQVQPGRHLVELMSKREALHTQELVVAGGGDNQLEVNLSTSLPIPSVRDVRGASGWMYLGEVKAGKLSGTVTSTTELPKAGESVMLAEPAFLRTTPTSSGAGNAFAWADLEPSLRVNETQTIGNEYWVRVTIPQENP